MSTETHLISSRFAHGSAAPYAAPATYVIVSGAEAPATLTAPIQGDGGQFSHHVRLQLVSPQRHALTLAPDPAAFRTLVVEALGPLLAGADRLRRSDDVLAIEDSLRDLRALLSTNSRSTDLRDRYSGELFDVVRCLTALLRPAIRALTADIKRCTRVDCLSGWLERSEALRIVHLVGGAWLLHLALAPQATAAEERAAVSAYLARCDLLEKAMADAIEPYRLDLENEQRQRREQNCDWYEHQQFERAFEDGMTHCDAVAAAAARSIRWFAHYLRSAVASDVRLRRTGPNLTDLASTLGGLVVARSSLNPSTLAAGAAGSRASLGC